MEEHVELVTRLKASFRSGITVPQEFRRVQLMQLKALVNDNEEQFLKALNQDLAKPRFEAALSEIILVNNELHCAISNLSSWMEPEYTSKNLATKFDEAFVRREPLGVVLVIGPWNYPLQLLILPLLSAIAAGNCVVLKPSEVSAATACLIAELIPKYLHQDCYAVVCGGAEETKALLKNQFDHIFYTGTKTIKKQLANSEPAN